MLDRIDSPAQIVSDLGVTLSQNAQAEALTDPDRRRLHPEADHELHSRIHAGSLRSVRGRAADDPEARELVDALLRESDEFAALWERHEVPTRPRTTKRFVHPLIGPLTLDCQILTSENLTERLVVFTASPSSQDADRLALLSVISAQGFSSGAALGAT